MWDLTRSGAEIVDILEAAGSETPDISIPNSVRELVGDFQYGETE